MNPSCPTCKSNYSLFFGPANSPNLPFNANFYYPICYCHNRIAVNACNGTQHIFHNTDRFHLIFLENLFSSYFEIIKPLRTFTNKQPAPEFRKRFEIYIKKYKITTNFTGVSGYTLFNLLAAVDNKYPFNKIDIDYLNEIGLHTVSANYYIQEYDRTFNPWSLIKSCSSWRKAAFPEIGLQISDKIKPNNNRQKAAKLTTIGAAYKDLKDLNTAERCARDALKHEETKYPYSLLGAIYYLYGLPSKGDEYFKKALELGQSKKEQDRAIFKAYLTAGKSEKDEIIKYLSTNFPKRHLSLIQNESFKQAA
jgi:hypothetical protein